MPNPSTSYGPQIVANTAIDLVIANWATVCDADWLKAMGAPTLPAPIATNCYTSRRALFTAESQPKIGLSVIRTLRAVERCNIAVLLLDSTEGLTDQDVRIAGLCDEKGRGLIIVANKWDVVEKDAKSADRLREQIALKMPFVAYAPVLFLSGMTGLRMPKLLDQIDRVRAAQTLRVGTGQLNRWLEDCVARHQPPVNGVRRLRLYYGTQVGVAPPTIVLSCNNTEAVHLSYKRYLCNQFREVFDVPGTPVRLIFRARGESPASSGDDEEERETED